MSLIDLKTYNSQTHNSQIYDFKTYILIIERNE